MGTKRETIGFIPHDEHAEEKLEKIAAYFRKLNEENIRRICREEIAKAKQ